jgi:hypothetical protein
MIGELEKLAKRLVEIRNSEWGCGLKAKNIPMFLTLSALSSTAELMIRLIAEDTRHDQW